jgi:hypothetical protein
MWGIEGGEGEDPLERGVERNQDLVTMEGWIIKEEGY